MPTKSPSTATAPSWRDAPSPSPACTIGWSFSPPASPPAKWLPQSRGGSQKKSTPRDVAWWLDGCRLKNLTLRLLQIHTFSLQTFTDRRHTFRLDEGLSEWKRNSSPERLFASKASLPSGAFDWR